MDSNKQALDAINEALRLLNDLKFNKETRLKL